MVEIAQEFQPDLLISDVIMLGMTGIETAIQIQLMQPSCKVLLLSGHAATADLIQKAHTENHKFDLLAKPVHPKDLLAKLRNVLP